MPCQSTRLIAGLFALGIAVSPAVAQVYATPLPPGPGTVPFIPNGRLVAPVLLPVGAPTAAPVAIYTYPTAPGVQAATTDCTPATPCPDVQPKAHRFWASADFLYGATQGAWVPPLVTMAPPGSPPPTAGSLGTPSTILFGGQRNLNATRPGLMFRTGYWFDDAGTRGLDAGLFFLGGLSERFIGSSGPGGVVLARPFVTPDGTNLALPVAGPFPGGITASVDNRVIGADVNYRRALRCGDCCRLDLLVGYRYLHLGDTVDIWTSSALPIPAGQGSPTLLSHDSFRTRNDFHGPQIGLVNSCRLAPGLSLDLVAKLAMGVTVSERNADSQFVPTGVTLPPGGFVVPNSSFSDRTNYFAVVPEAGVRLGYCLTDCVKVSAGYTFLYWSKVRRASEQINLTEQPLLGHPSVRNDTSDVWVQGWTLGVELRY